MCRGLGGPRPHVLDRSRPIGHVGVTCRARGSASRALDRRVAPADHGGMTRTKLLMSIVRLVSVAVVALVVLPLLVVAPAAPASAAAAPGFRTAKLDDAGIAVEYPDTWTKFGLTKKALAAQRKALAKNNPELVKYMDADSEQVDSASLYVRDFVAALDGQVSSMLGVNVLPGGGFPPSFGVFRRELSSRYESIGATVVDASERSVGGRPAYRLDVRLPVVDPDGVTVTMQLSQLMFRNAHGVVLVTLGTSPDDAGAQLADQVMGSVRPL